MTNPNLNDWMGPQLNDTDKKGRIPIDILVIYSLSNESY